MLTSFLFFIFFYCEAHASAVSSIHCDAHITLIVILAIGIAVCASLIKLSLTSTLKVKS